MGGDFAPTDSRLPIPFLAPAGHTLKEIRENSPLTRELMFLGSSPYRIPRYEGCLCILILLKALVLNVFFTVFKAICKTIKQHKQSLARLFAQSTIIIMYSV